MIWDVSVRELAANNIGVLSKALKCRRCHNDVVCYARIVVAATNQWLLKPRDFNVIHTS